MPETPGERLYAIRLACGDGRREPETLSAFSARLAKAGHKYSAMTLSLLERMEQTWKINDAVALSSVDPLGRGALWLSGLDQEPAVEAPDPTKDRKLTMTEIRRAKQKVDRAKGESAERKPRKRKGRGGA